jgi:hypothetical protein
MHPHAFTCVFRALKETFFRVGAGMADVQFIGSPGSQQILLNQLRPCQPSQTDPSMQRDACAEADPLSKRTGTRDRSCVAEAFYWVEELGCDVRLHAARTQQLGFLCRLSSICAISCDWQRFF